MTGGHRLQNAAIANLSEGGRGWGSLNSLSSQSLLSVSFPQFNQLKARIQGATHTGPASGAQSDGERGGEWIWWAEGNCPVQKTPPSSK